MSADPSDHAAVFDRASATYDDVGVDFFSTFGSRLVQAAAVSTGESVLDIGTGRGAVLFPAARAVGSAGRVVGIDLAPGMVRRTSSDITAQGLDQASVALGDAADPPVAAQRFDAVLSSLVLFFLDDPAEGLRRWAGLVADGGRLGLTTFVDDDDDTRFSDIVKRYVDVPAQSPGQPPTAFELVRDPVWLDDAMATAGLPDITSQTYRHQTVFGDVDHWWRWAMSQGMRAALERLSDDQVPAFRADIADDLESRRLPDGRLGIHVTVRFTVARRAA